MKRICVIWAGSGIGEALFLHYKRSGYDVDSITREDADLSNTQDTIQLIEKIKKQGYDIVIFSAGVWYYKEFASLTSQEIREQVYVNTLTPLQVLLALGVKTKFVYLSSIMQYIPAKNMSIYASMKRATSQTILAIQTESGDRKVLSIDLGAVKTPMHIKAGMKKTVWRDIEKVLPKLIKVIEKKQWTKTLFFDWWFMIHVIFPLYSLFLKLK